jgi:hypothetical protein
MRTSGGGSSDAWMMVIPLFALLVLTSFASGGTDALMLSLDSIARAAWQAIVDVVSRLF